MKILIAYDGSTHADAAIENLKRAGLHDAGDALIVCVADEGWPAVRGGESNQHSEGFASSWGERLHEAETLARNGCERFQRTFPGWTATAEALWGSASKAVLRTAEWWKPDLLVVGSHGRSAVGRLVLGSVSLALVHHAPCPIRVVRGLGFRGGTIKLLVAVDGSEGSQTAIEAITRRAWPEGTEVRVLAVVEAMIPPTLGVMPGLESNTFATEPAFQLVRDADERTRERLRKATEDACKRLQAAGLRASSTVMDGDPRKAIVAESEKWGADAIFLGARGLGALDRLLLGSVSNAVLSHAACPVEVFSRGK